MANVVDFWVYKEYGVVAEYTTFHQHLEDIAVEFPDTGIRHAVEAAAWRSTQ